VLNLDDPAALELGTGHSRIVKVAEVQGVPEAKWRTGTKLVGEVRGCSPQRRVRVEGPITPSRSSQTILEKHADDGHHRQAAVVDLCQQALLLLLLVLNALAPRKAKGSVAIIIARILPRLRLQIEDLDGADKGNDLKPANKGDLGGSTQAVGDVLECKFL